MANCFKFYGDRGHGWLAVKTALLRELNIYDKITSYSYQKGQTSYLEEDCDASLFIKTYKDAFGDIKIVEKNCDRSPIRSYQNFEVKYE